MKFLANEYVTIYESPDARNIYPYTPAICVLTSGRMIVTLDIGRMIDGELVNDYGMIYISDDHGENWRMVHKFPFRHARPFIAGKSIYVLGRLDGLRIIRSDDNGETWSECSHLTTNKKKAPCFTAATNVWYRDDYVYVPVDKNISRPDDYVPAGWNWECNLSMPVLMRGNIKDDLLKPENWTYAESFRFCDVVKENDLNYHGIPFYKTKLQEKEQMGDEFLTQALGWMETNVVQIMDPKHYWYDETGHTFHLFMRAHTAGTGYCAIAKVVEQPDGTMKTETVKAPSGRDWVFLPMPGGQMKFFMLYDEQTQLYWLIGTQATDSMTRLELLSKERYNIPCDERQRLVLHFSKNCVDWCFAGIVAAGPSEKQSRHYASMAFDGEDLVIVSRSGDERAASAHNGNFVSFHRVRNFRDLVY